MSEYPDEKTLEVLGNLKSSEFAYISEIWNTNYGKVEEKDNTLTLVTGGWSGNEDIITALQNNKMWWLKHFFSYTRGGLWVFRVEA